MRLAISADIKRNAVVVSFIADGQQVGAVDLTPPLVEEALAHLLSAVQQLTAGSGQPGDPGSWTNVPTIDGAEWKLGVRPLDGSVTLSFRPANLGDQPMWLTYGFDRLGAENFAAVFVRTLAYPTVIGSA